MELIALWKVIKRRWWLIVIPAVVALVISIPALLASLRPAPQFQAGIRFSASQVPTAENTTDFQDKSYIPWLGSEYAVVNLATWTTTDSFAREVVTVLAANGVTLDADSVRGAIRGDAGRSIMTIYVQFNNADQVQAIADATTTVLQTKSGDYFAQLNAAPARIIPLDNVIVTPLAPPITTRLAPLLRVLIGLAAGMALAFLAEYLDRAVRSRSELEQIGFGVMGEIPG